MQIVLHIINTSYFIMFAICFSEIFMTVSMEFLCIYLMAYYFEGVFFEWTWGWFWMLKLLKWIDGSLESTCRENFKSKSIRRSQFCSIRLSRGSLVIFYDQIGLFGANRLPIVTMSFLYLSLDVNLHYNEYSCIFTR